MLRLANPLAHGVLDYGLALTFLLAPALFGFAETPTRLSYVIGFAYFGASLITKYPLGAIGLLSFPTHGVLEALMAAGWIVMPWLFGFAESPAARNLFVAAGIALLALVAVTDYRGLGTRAAYAGAERRQRGQDRRRRRVAVARDRRIADRRSDLAAA